MNPNDPDLPFGLVLFVALGLLGSLLLMTTRNHRETIIAQIRLFIVAFALRFLASVVIYQFGLVAVLGDEDSSGWVVGATLRQTWLQHNVGLFELPGVLTGAYTAGGHQGYYYLLGLLFYITGSPARLPAAALNGFFGALAVVFAYRIARALFSEWVATRVGWWTCILPSMIIWSAQTLKEPVVIFLEALALYACIHLRKSGFSVKYILLCVAVIVLVIPFRFYAAYIIGATILLTLLVPQFSKGKFNIGSAVGVGALLIGILVVSGQLLQQEAQLETFDLKRVQEFKRDVATGAGSGVEQKFDLKTTSGLISAIGFGGVHLLLAPFPWQWGGGSLRMLFVLPELFAWWYLFFAGAAPGLWQSLRKRFGDIQPLLIFLLGFGFLYSLMFGNVGLVYRQRAQLLPWLLIFAAVGLEMRMQKRAANKQSRIPRELLIEPLQ